MSLTSYRAAPPRVTIFIWACAHTNSNCSNDKGRFRGLKPPFLADFRKEKITCVFYRPGSDLLSRALRQSTIGAGAFHGRVRNGIGCSSSAITTRSTKHTCFEKLFLFADKFKDLSSLYARDALMRMSNENNQANRVISTGKLQALPLFHTRPINVVVFHGSQGILV